jgi:DNA-binding FadR family transcriptional regulator
VLESVGGLLHEIRVRDLAASATPQQAQQQHRAIFEAVERGDAKGAAAAMRQHLDA